MVGYLETYDGIWVKVLGGAFGKTVKMLVPYGGSVGSPPGPPGGGYSQLAEPPTDANKPLWARLVDFLVPDAHAKKPTWDQEWYVRLIAVSEDENLQDSNNVLGQLQESIAGYDRHDLPALLPFDAPYMSLSFPHYEWGDKAGSYTSDYHAVNTGDADQWTFEIHSDDPYRDIDLYWDGVYLLEGIWTQDNGQKTWSQSKQMDAGKLYGQMVLEDLDLGIQVKAMEDDVVNHYSFNMENLTVRTFRWVYTGEKTKKGKKVKLPKAKPVKASPKEPPVRRGYDPMKHVPKSGKDKG
jgi:hypothetical protein